MQHIKPSPERQLDGLREPFAAFIGAQATASGLLLLALVAAAVSVPLVILGLSLMGLAGVAVAGRLPDA